MATASADTYITELREHVRNAVLSTSLKVLLSNLANDEFAMMAPWKWLCESQAAITLASAAQSYTWTPDTKLVEAPVAYLYDEGSFRLLQPMSKAPVGTDMKNYPTHFDIVQGAADATITLWPPPPSGLDGAKLVVIGKTEHVRVTSENLADANILHFPDRFAPIYQKFLLSNLYQWAQVGNPGQTQLGGRNQMAVTGARAEALAAAQAIIPTQAVIPTAEG